MVGKKRFGTILGEAIEDFAIRRGEFERLGDLTAHGIARQVLRGTELEQLRNRRVIKFCEGRNLSNFEIVASS